MSFTKKKSFSGLHLARPLDYAKVSAIDKRNEGLFLYQGISLFSEEQTPKYSW